MIPLPPAMTAMTASTLFPKGKEKPKDTQHPTRTHCSITLLSLFVDFILSIGSNTIAKLNCYYGFHLRQSGFIILSTPFDNYLSSAYLANMSDQIKEIADIPRDFLREGTQFLNR